MTFTYLRHSWNVIAAIVNLRYSSTSCQTV